MFNTEQSSWELRHEDSEVKKPGGKTFHSFWSFIFQHRWNQHPLLASAGVQTYGIHPQRHTHRHTHENLKTKRILLAIVYKRELGASPYFQLHLHCSRTQRRMMSAQSLLLLPWALQLYTQNQREQTGFVSTGDNTARNGFNPVTAKLKIWCV